MTNIQVRKENDMNTCPTLERLAIELGRVKERLNLAQANLRYARKKIALLEKEKLNLSHALLKAKGLDNEK